ncbi:MAG: class I SAM-dependent methyltransferase [Bacteroidetes bacterium]|nr:class I SAM-dependent methyltransferase [Bacteroidota bacterium]
MFDKREHWEGVYQRHKLNEVSWYEPIPETSLSIINKFKLPKDAAIIDIGGGDSLLADYLLLLGYSNITVLDISERAIERAKARLGWLAQKVTWVVSDVLHYTPEQKYALWHDRATFHFFTGADERQQYLNRAHSCLQPDAYMVLSTFSTNGPQKCSGLTVQQYSETSLSTLLNQYFEKIRCITRAHVTPMQVIQDFIYCSFRNRALNI